ncbi:MAG: DUF1049 domain-containing protein [Scytolyngbya sp. HA4215-MV1]|jgi:hypothetical protein|nr:DUF1049 domain-containing protein [Scytolyngbya sp. HA4215-MV1]
MKSLTNLLLAAIITTWVIAIAILSVQNVYVTDAQGNASLVSLKFLTFQSIKLPLGIVLAFGVGTGVAGTAILLPLLGSSSTQNNFEDDDLEEDF